MDDWLLGALFAFGIAVITTPAGVSGAVLLLPVQASVLHVPNPALTPTNLLYNVVATPGSLLRFHHEGRARSPLTRSLLAGTIPGVVLGAVLRVEVLSGPKVFLLIVAAVLASLGAWLASGRTPDGDPDRAADRRVVAVAFVAGTIGGIYGIGGGSLIGPVLAASGFSLYVIAPAALTSTFVTSLVGVATYEVLQRLEGTGTIGPELGLGLAMGLGGLAGGYVGAQLQHRIPERRLRRLLGVVCLALAARYVAQGLELG